MVHPNIEISGLNELQQARAENLKLRHAFRQMSDERALLFLEPWNVRVTKKRYAVWAKADDLIHRVREALGRLVRQAINQVHVNALESQPPRADKQVARHFKRLYTMHRLLHFRLKILNPHAQPVEAQLAKSFQMCAGGDAGIDLDADFALWSKGKMVARKFEKALDLLR